MAASGSRIGRGQMRALIRLKNPLFLGSRSNRHKTAQKTSLWNDPYAIFSKHLESFGGVFNCSFLILWGFSAESTFEVAKAAEGSRTPRRFANVDGYPYSDRSWSAAALYRFLDGGLRRNF